MFEILDYKNIFIFISMVLAIVSFVPYIVGIFKGKIKPHLYTWFIWTMVNLVAFSALWYTDAGFSFLGILIGFFFVGFIFLLSFKYGIKDRKRIDLVFLFLSFFAIFLWWKIGNPFYSVILISLVNILGYFPTLRKTIKNPESEKIFFWIVSPISILFLLFSLNNFNFVSSIFLLTLLFGNLMMFFILLYYKIKKVYK